MLSEWVLLQPEFLHIVDLGLTAFKMSTSADQLQDVHEHQAPAQPHQLPDVEELMHQDAPSLLDVDQVYLQYENGGATIINVDEIGPDAKKKIINGREVIELCDDGIHRLVWETCDEWQCL